MLHVKDAKYLQDYMIWLSFDDGSSGEVDLSAHLNGAMFRPLKDKTFFSQVKFDSELETIVWPNGADLAPEFLKDILQKHDSKNTLR
jgi:hypothetical protein